MLVTDVPTNGLRACSVCLCHGALPSLLQQRLLLLARFRGLRLFLQQRAAISATTQRGHESTPAAQADASSCPPHRLARSAAAMRAASARCWSRSASARARSARSASSRSSSFTRSCCARCSCATRSASCRCSNCVGNGGSVRSRTGDRGSGGGCAARTSALCFARSATSSSCLRAASAAARRARSSCCFARTRAALTSAYSAPLVLLTLPPCPMPNPTLGAVRRLPPPAPSVDGGAGSGLLRTRRGRGMAARRAGPPPATPVTVDGEAEMGLATRALNVGVAPPSAGAGWSRVKSVEKSGRLDTAAASARARASSICRSASSAATSSPPALAMWGTAAPCAGEQQVHTRFEKCAHNGKRIFFVATTNQWEEWTCISQPMVNYSARAVAAAAAHHQTTPSAIVFAQAPRGAPPQASSQTDSFASITTAC